MSKIDALVDAQWGVAMIKPDVWVDRVYDSLRQLE
jgi:hypothetical protein